MQDQGAEAKTLSQYNEVLDECAQLFERKIKDYGCSWAVLRPLAIVDQLFIKAWRIRQLQEKKVQMIEDSVDQEWIAIANYGIIALIQMNDNQEQALELKPQIALSAYKNYASEIQSLMLKKNHDYGEAWRHLSMISFVDLILVKLLRIRQILGNNGEVSVSEGIAANLHDIVNYALFARIQIKYSA